MKIIVSGIFSFIGLLLIFIINLSKGKGIVGILVSPIVGAAIIFGVIFGVLLLLSKILNVDAILAEKHEDETSDTSSKSSSTGKNVNFTISDEDDDTVADKADSVSSVDSGNSDLHDISTDKPLSFSDLEDDSEDTAESDLRNKSGDFDSRNEDFSMKKTTPGLPPEEIIKDKLGVAATPEDIAKGIKTILKRQGGLADDKQ